MIDITYVDGDATDPVTQDHAYICHVCNDVGGWGRGFVTAISKKWNLPENSYRNWAANGPDFELGEVQFVRVEPYLTVVNMIAQHNVFWQGNVPPIRYGALDECLEKVRDTLIPIYHGIGGPAKDVSVHMPRIGCGLAGGKWEEVERIIEKTLLAADIPVFVYDLPK